MMNLILTHICSSFQGFVRKNLLGRSLGPPSVLQQQENHMWAEEATMACLAGEVSDGNSSRREEDTQQERLSLMRRLSLRRRDRHGHR